MRLALQLGRPNVDEMLQGLSAQQFAEWRAFYALEPWGYHEERGRMSTLAATIANYAGKVLPKGRVVEPKDFMPAEARPSRASEVVAKVKAFFGGR